MEADPRRREERPVTAARLQTETTNEPKRTALQAHGQVLQATRLREDADRLQAVGAWPAARRARHQARRLAALARGAA